MTPLFLFLFLLAARAPILPGAAAAEADAIAECDGWASAGECSLNPRYMLENCPVACKKQAEADKEMAREIGELVCHVTYY